MSGFLLIFLFYTALGFSLNEARNHSSQIFFAVDEYHNCSFIYNRQRVYGECKTFANCSVAIDLWKNENFNPVTCYYEKRVHIVCCLDRKPSLTTIPALKTTTYPTTVEKLSSKISITTASTPTSSSTNSYRDQANLLKGDECTLWNSSINGTCKKYFECPSAFKMWKNESKKPTQCLVNTDMICCVENKTNDKAHEAALAALKNLRRNELYCEEVYGPAMGQNTMAKGVLAEAKEFPYMVALGWTNSSIDNATSYQRGLTEFGWLSSDYSTSFRCGGVLIARNYVLTAAHCTDSGGKPPQIARVGGDDLNEYSTVSERAISDIFVHPKYDSIARSNDIAILRLNDILLWQNPACLWNKRDLLRDDLLAAGYGNTRFAGPSSDQLIKVFLFSVPTSECQQSYDEKMLDTHICAGKTLNDTCQGDSGGPLVMYEKINIYPYLVGITSFGNPCGGGTPGVYTRVSEYIDWIEGIVFDDSFDLYFSNK